MNESNLVVIGYGQLDNATDTVVAYGEDALQIARSRNIVKQEYRWDGLQRGGLIAVLNEEKADEEDLRAVYDVHTGEIDGDEVPLLGLEDGELVEVDRYKVEK